MAQRLAPTVGCLGRADPIAGEHASGGGYGVDGIGLAVAAAHAAFRPQHLVHGVAGCGEPARERGPVRVGTLDAHAQAQGRAAYHGDQPFVALRVRIEGLGVGHPPVFVEQGQCVGC